MSSSPVASSAATLVVERVRERLRAEASDAGRHPDAVRSIARAEIRRHNDFALARGLVPIDDEAGFVREVLAAVSGYGPLQPYLDDPTIEELWINAPELGLLICACCTRPANTFAHLWIWFAR